MQADLGDLKIAPEMIEELVDLNLRKTLAIDVCRALLFRKPKQILSVCVTELVALGLTLIFVMPVSLIIFRSFNAIPEETTKLIQLLTLIFGFSLVILLLGNVYLWNQARQIKPLVSLMEEVNKYNRVIQAIELIDKLESASHSELPLTQLSNRQELLEALKITQDSLISALKVDKIIREHQGLINRRYELLANLEENLTTLMTFDMSHSASEYGHLLNEALQIGMSVHKEVRKLKTHHV